MSALRYNEGKPKWSLVDFEALEPMVRVLEFGAKKYEPHNWKKGLNREENLESIMRHLVSLIAGEEIDPESGLPHIGHLLCGGMFHSHFNIKKHKELDEKINNLTFKSFPLGELRAISKTKESPEAHRASESKRCSCEKGYDNEDRECSCSGPKD